MTEYKQLTLRQAAKFDFETGQKNIVTGWGRICSIRAKLKTARKYKVKKNESQ